MEMDIEFSCSTFARSARYRTTDNSLHVAQSHNNIEQERVTYCQ